MKPILRTRGFTLIELLVVITIIAVLASIAFPVYNKIIAQGKLVDDTNNARQIVLAMRSFAGDNDGFFPRGDFDDNASTGSEDTEASSSTQAFNDIYPDYIPAESTFYTPGHPDKRKPNEDGTLEPDENCWAYVTGASDTTDSYIPIIANWFTAGIANYDQNHPWWASNKAVVCFPDASARARRLRKDGSTGFILADDKNSNLFDTQQETGEGGIGRGGLIPQNMTVVNPD